MIIIASKFLKYSSINKHMQMHYYSMMLWYMHILLHTILIWDFIQLNCKMYKYIQL